MEENEKRSGPENRGVSEEWLETTTTLLSKEGSRGSKGQKEPSKKENVNQESKTGDTERQINNLESSQNKRRNQKAAQSWRPRNNLNDTIYESHRTNKAATRHQIVAKMQRPYELSEGQISVTVRLRERPPVAARTVAALSAGCAVELLFPTGLSEFPISPNSLSDNLDALAAAIVRLASPDLSSDLAFPIAGGLSVAGVLKTVGDDETPPRGRSVDRFHSSLSACR